MKPVEHLTRILVLSRRRKLLREKADRCGYEGTEYLRSLGGIMECNREIGEHLATLDADGWLEWLVGELESANPTANQRSVGAL